MEAVRPWTYFPGMFLHALRGHFRVTAGGSRLPLLLPLRGIANSCRMPENVRIEAQRLPLVGHQLRETSYAPARK